MADSRVVTVMGGTGFVGGAVVQHLRDAGFSVRIASRHAPDGIATPIDDDGAVRRAVEGAWAVVNLVSVLGGPALHAVNVDGAERVARMARLCGVARFVQMSAIGADLHAPSAYGRSKALGERGVRAHRPDATILRPSIIYGAGDHFFTRFIGLARWLPVLPVYAGDARFQPVHVDDVARAVVRCLLEPVLVGRCLELGGPDIVTMRALMGRMMELAGRPVRLVDVPPRLAWLQAGVLERLPGGLLTRDQLLMLSVDAVVAPGAEGFETLGIVPEAMKVVLPEIFI